MQQVGAAVNDRRGHVLSRLDTADFNGVSCMFEQEAVTEKKKKKEEKKVLKVITYSNITFGLCIAHAIPLCRFQCAHGNEKSEKVLITCRNSADST